MSFATRAGLRLLRYAGPGARTRPLARVVRRSLPSRAASTAASNDVALLSSTLVAELKSLSAIHVYYPKLVSALQSTPTTSSSPPPPTLTRDQLLQVLDVLATSGRPTDLQRIEEILTHMPTVFGIPVTIDIHTVIIRGLIQHATDHTVYRWLHSMPSRLVPFTPTLEQFHMFLEACEQRSHFKYVRQVVCTMRETGCKPTNETFKYLIRSRWALAIQEEKVPSLSDFTSMLDDMKLEDLPYDPSIDELLYNSYVEQNAQQYAKKIREAYRYRFPDLQKDHFSEWKDEIIGVAQSKGVEKAIDHYFQVMVPKGCDPVPQLFRAILRHSTTLDDVRLVQKKFNLPPSVDQYSVLIMNNVRAGLLDNALSIYEESKTIGIVPDAGLVHPIIKAFCRSPTDENLDKALAIYRDLAAVAPPYSKTKESLNEHAPGPDSTIYNTLLRGIAASEDLDKYFPIAKELMDDMNDFNIATDKKNASSIIVLFMRRAKSLPDALDAYYGLRSTLDEQGYAVVLNAFCQLSFNNELPVPSLSSYFEIVKDMRRAGLEITVEVYTILLKQLGSIPARYRSRITYDHVVELVTTVRRVHDFLTLDAAVSPDEQVWNQLMDTYQRLGCFGDAYRVWNTMYIAGQFDHISVSIIFDACGYAGARNFAKKVFSQLSRDRFSLNRHNWNTWVECLCRLNQLDEALRTACQDMGKNENTVPPDVETARILIKFARRNRVEADVLEWLQQFLPELWKTLPEDLRAGERNNEQQCTNN
ncbi:hypothetical protein C0995_011492 [Termitomyces sp. Mi166|nr:hypothetical protein C0995_011492 [Termitomyces sp. Mi166\